MDDAQRGHTADFEDVWAFLINANIKVVIATTHDMTTLGSPAAIGLLPHVFASVSLNEVSELPAEFCNSFQIPMADDDWKEYGTVAKEEPSLIEMTSGEAEYHIGVIGRVLDCGQKNLVSSRRHQVKQSTILELFCVASWTAEDASIKPEFRAKAAGFTGDTTRGFIDFYVNDTVPWAIELLRLGSGLKEQRNRFHPVTGRYRTLPTKNHLLGRGYSRTQGQRWRTSYTTTKSLCPLFLIGLGHLFDPDGYGTGEFCEPPAVVETTPTAYLDPNIGSTHSIQATWGAEAAAFLTWGPVDLSRSGGTLHSSAEVPSRTGKPPPYLRKIPKRSAPWL